MSAVISVRALSSVAPSRSRATPVSVKRNDALARVDCAAIHMSVRASGKLKEAGMTPTTAVGTPSNADRPADDARDRAVAAYPQPVREDGHRRGARDAFFFDEPPAERRRHAEHDASDGVVLRRR